MSALLPITPAHQLERRPPERRWLIEPLWAAQAVGIVGGEPKCCKSFLALDVALAVASGAPCLRRFPPAQTGRVLLYAAEDALHVVRQRLHGIALAAGVDFAALDIQVITAPSLRLDLPGDQDRLRATVDALRPTLLVLDPFVRLHRIDENAAADVAPMLAYLRDLQRHRACAVLLVHHARKGAPPISAPARHRAAPPSCTPGATPTSICTATAPACGSPSNTARPPATTASRSSCAPAATPSPCTSSTRPSASTLATPRPLPRASSTSRRSSPPSPRRSPARAPPRVPHARHRARRRPRAAPQRRPGREVGGRLPAR